MKRRHFIHTSIAAASASSLFADHHGEKNAKKNTPLYEISLAQWSLHRAHAKKELNNLDFPRVTKEEYGINAVEYVNRFFNGKGEDQKYLAELKKRTTDLDVTNVLIMVDGEGHLGADTEAARQKTIDNHKKWVAAAKYLGCHSIRVNSHGHGATDDEKAANCVKGLAGLSAFAKDHDINVIVENHGGLSSNGAWMAKVLKEVAMDNCGSLPDFGNFHGYDRYLGLEELMPYAKGVSAKSHSFDAEGNETGTDYAKAIAIVLKHNYHGHIGIEYEGSTLSEKEGILATKKLLEKIRTELSS